MPFENAIAVKQSVIEDRDLGFGLIQKLSIKINERFRLAAFVRSNSLGRIRFGWGRRDSRGFNILGQHEKTSGESDGNSSEKHEAHGVTMERRPNESGKQPVGDAQGTITALGQLGRRG